MKLDTMPLSEVPEIRAEYIKRLWRKREEALDTIRSLGKRQEELKSEVETEIAAYFDVPHVRVSRIYGCNQSPVGGYHVYSSLRSPCLYCGKIE